MEEITFNINGKEYTLEEIMGVYEFWQCYNDTDDINDAIAHVIDCSGDYELSKFANDNAEVIRAKCIEHFDIWHNTQSNILNFMDASIFDLALQLIDEFYFNLESNVPF